MNGPTPWEKLARSWRRRRDRGLWQSYVTDGWWGWPLWLAIFLVFSLTYLMEPASPLGIWPIAARSGVGSLIVFLAVANIRRVIQGKSFWLLFPQDFNPTVEHQSRQGAILFWFFSGMQLLVSALILWFAGWWVLKIWLPVLP